QVGEDEPEVLLGRIAPDAHFGGEAGVLGGLLDALARGVVLPAVVEAAQAVALHPARRELRAAVRAAEVHEVGDAALTAIEGELLAHDRDRFGVAGREVAGEIDRLPEAAQVAAGQRAGPGVDEVIPGRRSGLA